MKVECSDQCLTIVPEDAQDRAYLQNIMNDGMIVLSYENVPIGFGNTNPQFVMQSGRYEANVVEEEDSEVLLQEDTE